MAQRRMFSKAIVNSEEFVVMPKSSQALYFHLGMEADDDGFIHPGQVMRAGGFQGDDLKILLAKRFILTFESGVVVIKHWLIHNLIQKDRHIKTRYQEELNSLFIKENKAYTDNLLVKKSVNKVLPQVRLGKDRISKVRLIAESNNSAEIVSIIDSFKEINPAFNGWYKNKSQREAAKWLVDTYGLEEAKRKISLLPRINKVPFAPITTTPCQLRDNMAKIEAFILQRRGKENKIIGLD